MSSKTDFKPFLNRTVGAAIGAHKRVKIAAGVLAVADDDDTDAIGTTLRETFGAGETVAVGLFNGGGVQNMVAAGAISAGATVYAAADGEVDASGTVAVGMAIDAATAANDIIGVLPT
jgi:hypothetical protein